MFKKVQMMFKQAADDIYAIFGEKSADDRRWKATANVVYLYPPSSVQIRNKIRRAARRVTSYPQTAPPHPRRPLLPSQRWHSTGIQKRTRMHAATAALRGREPPQCVPQFGCSDIVNGRSPHARKPVAQLWRHDVFLQPRGVRGGAQGQGARQ